MYQPQKRKGNGVDRVGRKFQILTLLQDWENTRVNGKDAEGVTVYWIARQLGLTPSNHLRGLVYELCCEEVVCWQQYEYRPNMPRNVYWISPNARWQQPYLPLFDVWLGSSADSTPETQIEASGDARP